MQTINQELKSQSMEISILVNRIFYFLEYAYILKSGDQYRLVTANQEKVQVDESYGSTRGAKIAFARLYKNQRFTPLDEEASCKPNWSHFYQPDARWLNQLPGFQRPGALQ